MENQKTSSTQIMLNYGLILGFVSIILSVANFAFGDIYRPHWSIQVVTAVISIALMVMGIKKFKEGNGGLLSLGQALKIGLGISLISGLVSLVYLFVFTNYIEPEFYTNMAAVQEQIIMEKNPNMSDEQIEMSVGMMKKMMGFGATSIYVMVLSLFFGFIVSLISGLIMKKSEE